MIKSVYYTPTFEKHFKKLPKQVKLLALKKEGLFRVNPVFPSLKTHPLSGVLKGYNAFSVNYNYRILFKFENSQSVTFINIGTHEIYK